MAVQWRNPGAGEGSAVGRMGVIIISIPTVPLRCADMSVESSRSMRLRLLPPPP
jgi:hypothetical protein